MVVGICKIRMAGESSIQQASVSGGVIAKYMYFNADITHMYVLFDVTSNTGYM